MLTILARNIKYLRQSKHMTQKELAKLLKKSGSTVSSIENSTRNVTQDMQQQIANIFGITAEQLGSDSLKAGVIIATQAGKYNTNVLNNGIVEAGNLLVEMSILKAQLESARREIELMQIIIDTKEKAIDMAQNTIQLQQQIIDTKTNK